MTRNRIRLLPVVFCLVATALRAHGQSTDLQAVSLTAPSGTFYAGDTVLVGYQVRNNGPNPAFGYTVVMHASSDPVIQASDPETARFDNNPLASGASYTGLALTTLPWDLPAGTHYLGMRIVYALDSTSGNNTAYDPDPVVVLPPSNLWVSWVGHDVGTVRQGGTKWVRYEIRNLGPGDCPGFRVKFYASHDRGLGIGDRELLTLDQAPLPNDSSRTADVYDVPIPADLPPGHYYIGVAAEYAHDSWEYNNVGFGQSDFLVTGAPDLEVEEVSIPEGEYHPGDPAEVALTIRNIGLGTSYGHAVAFYASPDANIGPGDLELASVQRDVQIEPQARDVFTQDITLPLAVGSWYIGAVVTNTADPVPANNDGVTPLNIVHHALRVTRCERYAPAILHIWWTSHAYDGQYRIHAAESPDGPFAPILSSFSATPPENDAYIGLGTRSRLFLKIATEP